MGSLGEELTSKLSIKVLFEIPIFGGIPISETVVTTWIIMAILIILAAVFARNLKVQPVKKSQVIIEMVVGGLAGIIEGSIGPKGRKFVPYLGSVGLFLVVANICGALGVSPPTRDLNLTVTLALMSIILVQATAIKEKKVSGWLKHYIEPTPALLPLNLMELVTRPLTLCMRLFGNMVGGFIIMELLRIAVPIFIPVPVSFYFDLFDGLMQAYIFVFLTSIYIHESV